MIALIKIDSRLIKEVNSKLDVLYPDKAPERSNGIKKRGKGSDPTIILEGAPQVKTTRSWLLIS
jgi:hypothetical protein